MTETCGSEFAALLWLGSVLRRREIPQNRCTTSVHHVHSSSKDI